MSTDTTPWTGTLDLATAEEPRRSRFNRQPVSAWTHFGGFVLAVAGLVALVVPSLGDGPRLVVNTVYAGSLALLFLCSAAYHFFDLGPMGNRWLRRLDHSVIFLLIAGTYLPPLLYLLDGAWRVAMIAVMGGLAVAGIGFKLCWLGAPRWVTAGIYLAMGWLIVVPGYRMLPQLGGLQLLWLAGGGLTYSAGAVIYASRWPDPWPGRFGFHEVWHLFVLVAALLHYLFIRSFLGAAYPPFG